MDSFTAIAIASLAIALVFSTYYIPWKPRPSSSQKLQPPEAGRAWPIIGHLRLLGGPQPPHITLGKLADKYGSIFTIRIGVQRAIVVSGSEIAKECFTTNDKAFANRPKAVASEHMAYNYAMFVFSPYGPYWRQLRRIATLELLSNHRLQSLNGVRESEVKTAVREIHEQWVKNGRVLVDMKRWFGDLTLNLALRTVVGKRCGRETSGDDRCREAIMEFFRLTGTFVVGDAIPWLRWFDFGGHEKAMKKTAKELDQILEGLLDEHKRMKRLASESDEQDFMGVMLSYLDGTEEISGYDADTVNKSTCLALILGGTSTSMVTLTWALALLLNNRETLAMVQKELDDHVGRERQVKESDIANLVYLQAVLKETLRLYPALPLLLPHESSEDCAVGGYHVPAGTRLLVNASKIHRDPSTWPDPSEFRPERFLARGDRQNVDVGGQSFELIPFGAGRRICPGLSFSFQVMSLALASLLHGFEVTRLPDEPVDLRGTAGLSNLIASSLDVLVTPRLPAGEY